MKTADVTIGLEVEDTVRNLTGTVTILPRMSRDTYVVWINRNDNGMPALCCVGDLKPVEKTGIETLRGLLDLG